jgi:AcrR family transcriptional regulator
MPVLGKTKKDVLLEFRTAEILAAARSEFALRGFANATLDSIADRVGIAKGTIYLYFPSKTDLFLALLRQGVLELHQDVRREMDAAADTRGKLRAFLRARLSYCGRNRDFFRIYYTEFVSLRTRITGEKAEFHDLYEQQAQVLESVLCQGIRQGELRELNVPKAARLVYEVIRAAVAQHVLEQTGEGVEETADFTMDLILKGIAC